MQENPLQELINLLQKVDDPKLIESLYWYTQGYLFGKQKKEKAPDALAGDHGANEINSTSE